MINHYFPALQGTVAPALANHLWQSTLVVTVAGLFTLTLRRHHARARHWLWLAASLKFLVPFFLLVRLGNYVASSQSPIADAKPSLYFTIDEISRPFTSAVTHPAATPASSVSVPVVPLLFGLWLCGFLAVVLLWIARWRRISAAMKAAVPLSEGREISALRRSESLGGIRDPIALRLSQASIEPGIFGIARPVLIWPAGISAHLADAHLEAVLAHEVWHVRRRDNLFALLHMLVEAIFWFYPLVWWLGARLVDERERACDEEVVALGGDRHVYAESILKVCEFCLGSPLPCVSGVTGADLKKRMVHIMNDRILHNLGLGRKLLLTTAAALAIAIPVTIGLFTATPSRAQEQDASSNLSTPVFSTVSVKLSEPVSDEAQRMKTRLNLMDGSFVARGATLKSLIQLAYRIQDSQIAEGPDWLNSLFKTKFDIDAKLDPSATAAMHKQMAENNSGELKALLADKFKLAVHFETRTLPAYDLLVDETGAKMQPAGEGPHMMRLGRGELAASGAPLDQLTAQLSARLGRIVVDKTGLKANYSFNLHWTPDPGEDERMKAAGEPVGAEPAADPNTPSLPTALQEQLGLKLKPHTEPVQVLVVDHAEMPSQE